MTSLMQELRIVSARSPQKVSFRECLMIEQFGAKKNGGKRESEKECR
jgi:hypothetical protein